MWKKKFFFEVGVFEQGDVVKKMFQKGYKISFRMCLNLCNAKFSRIDVENRVYGEVLLSLHFFRYEFPKFYVLYGNMRWDAKNTTNSYCV